MLIELSYKVRRGLRRLKLLKKCLYDMAKKMGVAHRVQPYLVSDQQAGFEEAIPLFKNSHRYRLQRSVADEAGKRVMLQPSPNELLPKCFAIRTCHPLKRLAPR